MREIGSPQAAISPAAAAPTSPMTVQVGFRPPELGSGPACAVAQVIQHRSEIEKLTPVTVTMQGDTAVLRGEVASEHDRAGREHRSLGAGNLARSQRTLGRREGFAGEGLGTSVVLSAAKDPRRFPGRPGSPLR